jgi:hypothetical protein
MNHTSRRASFVIDGCDEVPPDHTIGMTSKV